MTTKKQPRGRPKRKAEDQVRTIAWCAAIREYETKGPRHLSRVGGAVSAGSWSRYIKGSASPSPARVAEMESRYPGTARYFGSPLWRLLLSKQLPDGDLRGAFEWLQEPLHSHFVREGSTAKSVFWRCENSIVTDVGMVLSQLKHEDQTLDVATALACLFHEAALRQDSEAFSIVTEAWALCLDQLMEARAIWAVPQRLFTEFARNAFLLSAQLGHLNTDKSVARQRFAA
jgi:hypothetical protein